jgi:hypothetical protein
MMGTVDCYVSPAIVAATYRYARRARRGTNYLLLYTARPKRRRQYYPARRRILVSGCGCIGAVTAAPNVPAAAGSCAVAAVEPASGGPQANDVRPAVRVRARLVAQAP